MSGADAVKKLQQKFARIGSPPAQNQIAGNLERADSPALAKSSEPTVQLNVRVAPKLKTRIRLLAARDSISLSEVIVRAVALYEEKHGSAPEI